MIDRLFGFVGTGRMLRFRFNLQGFLLRAVLILFLIPASDAAAVEVRGQVLAQGSPLAGAQVEVFEATEPGWRWLLAENRQSEAVGRTAADQQGRFLLDLPGLRVWRLRVSAASYGAKERILQPTLDDLALYAVSLLPTEDLPFQLLAPGGQPVAGKLACAGCELGREADPELGKMAGGWRAAPVVVASDAAGRGRLPVVVGGGSSLAVQVEAQAPGFPAVSVALDGKGEGRILLAEGRPLSLQALDFRGRPVAGAALYRQEGLLPLATTDAHGRAQVFLPEQGAWQLLLISPHGLRGKLAVAAGSEDDDEVIPVSMEAPRRWVGQVVEEGTRRPLAGALVWQPAAEIPRLAVTDRQGRFALPMDQEEGGDLAALAAGYRPGEISPDGGPDLRLELSPLRRTYGWVVDGDGEPLAGARVRLVSASDAASSEPRPPSLATVAESDEQGYFSFSNPQPGLYSLKASATGFRPRQVPGLEITAATADLELGEILLEASDRLEGWVFDDSGRGVADAQVLVAAAGQGSAQAELLMAGAVASAASDTNGRFFFDVLLAAPSYHLRVVREGYLPLERGGVTVPASEPLELILEEAAAVAGWVVDDRGQAVEGALVTVRPQSGEGPVGSAESAAGGRFEVAGLVPGSQIVSAQAPGYQEGSLPPIELEGGEGREGVEIRLPRGLTVAGTVRGSDGSALEGVSVQVAAAEPSDDTSAFARSDAEGRFQLEGLASGEGFLPATLDGALTVEDSPLAYLEIVLQAGQTLRGQVLGVSFDDLSRVVVRALLPGRTVAAAVDHQGQFLLANLPPGELQIEAEVVGSPRRIRQSLTLAAAGAGATVALDLGG